MKVSKVEDSIVTYWLKADVPQGKSIGKLHIVVEERNCEHMLGEDIEIVQVKDENGDDVELSKGEKDILLKEAITAIVEYRLENKIPSEPRMSMPAARVVIGNMTNKQLRITLFGILEGKGLAEALLVASTYK